MISAGTFDKDTDAADVHRPARLEQQIVGRDQ
jgi:hypothetical protein